MPEMKTFVINGTRYEVVDETARNSIKGLAPGGYGLGGTASAGPTASDLNKCIANGWYWVTASTANVPAEAAYSSVFVKTRLDGQIVQEITPVLTNVGCKMTRISQDGGATWVEAWENPPMAIGVEYRTSERSNGSAVYAKRIAYSVGAIAADNAVVDTLIPHGISKYAYLVRSHCAKDSYVLPYLKDNGGFTAIVGADSTNITLRAYKANWAAATWHIDLYYVKY